MLANSKTNAAAFRAAFGAADHMRYCAHCKTQRSTYARKFIIHDDPAGKRCPNSGQPVARPDPLPTLQPDL